MSSRNSCNASEPLSSAWIPSVRSGAPCQSQRRAPHNTEHQRVAYCPRHCRVGGMATSRPKPLRACCRERPHSASDPRRAGTCQPLFGPGNVAGPISQCPVTRAGWRGRDMLCARESTLAGRRRRTEPHLSRPRMARVGGRPGGPTCLRGDWRRTGRVDGGQAQGAGTTWIADVARCPPVVRHP
jgi:hypothetical protein